MKTRFRPAAAAIALLAFTTIGAVRAMPARITEQPRISPAQAQVASVRIARVAPGRRGARIDERDDDRLLRRIDRIRDENCVAVMHDRPDFDGAILAGIIEQRQDQCMRRQNDDRRDDRQIARFRAFNDDRRDFARPMGAARFSFVPHRPH